MAFDFPNPPTAEPVTNPATGITYTYDASSQTWVVSGSGAADALETELDGLSNRIQTLENATAPSQVTYQIQTDKVLRSGEPAIELVDSDGYYSNVKFEATGGLAVSSSASSIIIDGSGIDAGGDYYTKSEIDDKISEIEVTKGTARRYVLDQLTANPTIREGKLNLDNSIAGSITYISLAPTDENGLERSSGEVGDTIELVRPSSGSYYRYKILGIIPDLASVEYISGSDQNDLFFQNQPFDVYVYPTQVNVADYYTKDECDSRFQRVDQANQLDNELRQLISNSVANLATKTYVDDEVNKIVSIYYGDYSPAGNRADGDMWFDSMHLRLNIWSQGAWINPDRNDGATLENRISALETRLAQLEGN